MPVSALDHRWAADHGQDGARAAAFDQLSRWSIGPVPGPFIVALLLAVAVWIVLERMPVGRYLYAVGANARAAELVGINRRRYVVGAMVTSGVLVAVAGVLLASRQARRGARHRFARGGPVALARGATCRP